jgi:hypothetical protein
LVLKQISKLIAANQSHAPDRFSAALVPRFVLERQVMAVRSFGGAE